jgi:hypothetical protein
VRTSPRIHAYRGYVLCLRSVWANRLSLAFAIPMLSKPCSPSSPADATEKRGRKEVTVSLGGMAEAAHREVAVSSEACHDAIVLANPHTY